MDPVWSGHMIASARSDAASLIGGGFFNKFYENDQVLEVHYKQDSYATPSGPSEWMNPGPAATMPSALEFR